MTHPYNHGRKEYIINLGYNDSDTVRTDGDIPQYRDLPRIQQPASREATTLIGDQTAARRETVLQDISFGDDMITGTVDAMKDTFLCVSWAGQQPSTERRLRLSGPQDMFLGVAVPAGEHQIRLLNETPGQKEGMALPISGLLLLAGIFRQNQARNGRCFKRSRN